MAYLLFAGLAMLLVLAGPVFGQVAFSPHGMRDVLLSVGTGKAPSTYQDEFVVEQDGAVWYSPGYREQFLALWVGEVFRFPDNLVSCRFGVLRVSLTVFRVLRLTDARAALCTDVSYDFMIAD